MIIIIKLNYIGDMVLLRVIKFFLISFLMFSECANSEGVFRYYLGFVGEDLIQLSAINESNLMMELPYNFCLSGVGDLKLEITDSNGVEYDLQVQLNDRCDVKKKVLVSPFSVVGKIFHKDEIISYYKLTKADFYIKAKFCKDNNKCSYSNVVSLNNR